LATTLRERPARAPGPAPARTGADHRRWTLRRDEKAQAIAELATRLSSGETVIAADFRGLTVKELAELRARLRAAETEFTVVKNTLARRAAAAAGREALLPYLDGPTGLAWVGGDPALAAKALNGFAGEHPDALAIKGGLLEGRDLPSADVIRLAGLPTREQLLGQLAGGVAAPLSGLAGSLSNLIGGLARSLGALQAQRADETTDPNPA
jgi:large subunit ribosomal protein L10